MLDGVPRRIRPRDEWHDRGNALVHILVVDDEPQVLRALRAALRGNGYDVQTATDGENALEQLASHLPDVVILDLVMPGKSGFDVLREMRTWPQAISGKPAIIVLSARDGERDKVTALDLGADDYIAKPFSIDELLARIRAALRHRSKPQTTEPVLQAGDVTIDLERRIVSRRGTAVHLTPTEWDILAELARNAGRVLTHRTLLHRVRGPQFADQPQYLRVFVNQLRDKIEVDPARPRLLVTEPGVGFRLVVDEVQRMVSV